MPFAALNGQQIHYVDSGGEGSALVFSHGLLMDHTMFAPQIERLRARYRCIAWDERGHGATAGASLAPFSYYDSADDLAALLAHLGIARAVLVGMSQGGYLSLRAALRHPTIVRALVLIDTQALPEDPAKLPAYRMLLESWAGNGLSDPSAAMIEQIVLGQNWPGAAAWKAKWRTAQPHDLLQCFRTLAERDDIGDAVRAIRVPTLVIHGATDIAIAPERGRALADAIPGARFELIAGAGHAANLTHPEAVNPLIERFLSTLE